MDSESESSTDISPRPLEEYLSDEDLFSEASEEDYSGLVFSSVPVTQIHPFGAVKSTIDKVLVIKPLPGLPTILPYTPLYKNDGSVYAVVKEPFGPIADPLYSATILCENDNTTEVFWDPSNTKTISGYEQLLSSDEPEIASDDSNAD